MMGNLPVSDTGGCPFNVEHYMATEIKMPDLGTTVEQVTLVAWLKNPGDMVKRGEALCEVETDKATSELESVAQGVLLKQMVPAGTEIDAGTVIAYVGKEGESIEPAAQAKPATTAEPRAQSTAQAQPSEGKVSPMIRNLAKRKGIDLATITGSGPGGQITRTDVLNAGKATDKPAAAAGIVLSKNQLGVARTIEKSYREIIPMSVLARVNMAVAIAKRSQQTQSGRKLSYDAIFVHATAAAMKQAERFQCYFDNDKLVSAGGVNVGVAISRGDDLFIPVVRDADTKPVEEIDREIRAFADKAAKGELSLAEMSGASFTISNLGMLPIEAFTAVVPPQQSGVLTVGSLSADSITTVILTVDHRFVNGRQAAEFVTAIKERMESL